MSRVGAERTRELQARSARARRALRDAIAPVVRGRRDTLADRRGARLGSAPVAFALGALAGLAIALRPSLLVAAARAAAWLSAPWRSLLRAGTSGRRLGASWRRLADRARESFDPH